MKNKPTILGHPTALFTLFFTEMWERFSYYGMRALLVLFLVSDFAVGGWNWSNADALKLYGIYTGLVYVTPIFGGILADRLIGHKNAVLIGALLMSLGHASMAIETPWSFYLGLTLLILGNGAFKPNVSSIVGALYENDSSKKDSAYTIFYMGINAGAFLGILLCGYIGEKVGWSYGFGLAGIFMFLGMVQFYFSKKSFPASTSNNKQDDIEKIVAEINDEKKLLAENDSQLDKEKITAELSEKNISLDSSDKTSLFKKLKLLSLKKIINDRLTVIFILAFFTIFFWMAFEQAGGSMTIFSKNFTNRILSGNIASGFKVFNALITIVPLGIITYVLILLFLKTVKQQLISSITLFASFIVIWGIALWMISNEFNIKSYTVEYQKTNYLEEKVEFNSSVNDLIKSKEIENLVENKNLTALEISKEKGKVLSKISYEKPTIHSSSIRTTKELKVGEELPLLISKGQVKILENTAQTQKSIKGKITAINNSQTEVPASWFGVLNSLFIIILAPFFSKIWESKYNPSAAVKFAIGVILLGLGFGVLAFGARGIDLNAQGGGVKVSMIWLVLAYFLHTTGELTLSPVGLSYVSKLSPKKLVGLMFGLWFTATAVANYLAGLGGSMLDDISKTYSLSIFFLIFTIIPIISGMILLVLNPMIKRKMHNIN